MTNKELRFTQSTVNVEKRTISGYAIRFNEDSVDLGGFVESVNPSAISEDYVRTKDIFAFFNHDDSKILGRSTANTLRLELRSDGLYYEIDVPDTQYGHDALEHISRNEMLGTSFAFSLPLDGSGEVWTRNGDKVHREIIKFADIYEVSPVFSPAYPTTSVSARSLDMLKEFESDKDEQEELRALDEQEQVEQRKEPEDEKDPEEKTESNDDKDEQTNDNDNSDSNNTEESTDDNEDENRSEDSEDQDEDKEDQEDEESEEQRNVEQTNTEKNKQNIKSKTMEKRFSLLKTINDIANGKKLDDVTNAVLAEGRNAFVKSGKEFSGQIQLPIGQPLEKRDTITVEAEGEDVVVTDFMNILAPLRAENVLAKAGARFITGLKGDLQFPIMSAENVYWEGETTEAKDGAGSFTNLKMSPRRISAYIDVSKQFLIQDTLDAESLIRQDLINAINSKIEETILGEAAADGYRPAGIFYNVTPTYVDTFAKLCDLEADVEETNIGGEMKYILSPKAKSALRSMPKSSKHTQLVLDAATIDGTPFETTTNMGQYKFAYGAWNNLAIGVWSGADLTIDPYTQATKACVRIIVDAFVDFKVLRDGAIVYGTVNNG